MRDDRHDTNTSFLPATKTVPLGAVGTPALTTGVQAIAAMMLTVYRAIPSS